MTATVTFASGPFELARLDESEVQRLVRTYGRSVSTALFDPNMQVFALPWLEGAIGYRQTWGCAVSVGDPFCPPPHRDALVEAFRGWCRAQGKDTIHAVVSDGFAAWLREQGAATVEFGYENVLDPRHDPLVGHAQQRLGERCIRPSGPASRSASRIAHTAPTTRPTGRCSRPSQPGAERGTAPRSTSAT